MIAPDTSVVIAALAPWHVAHAMAAEAMGTAEVGLVAHVAYETTSVLSRMPEGRRIGPDVVLDALERRFPDGWLALDAEQAHSALRDAVDAGVRGGALYDALIAATAREHGARLLSADRRAASTYAAVGARTAYLES